ncbi:hypothetical protein CEXT_620751 [Caerostris extrusa]|uniref:Ubiquitin-like protease family profile domain-containing protein n=1 Tax=Caerostris extrusa TaxID=172846 RepID=A0AAV4MPH1_CAEEX|nr:hypothetical protein CEXT_620751 [Caerostris extrusa]
MTALSNCYINSFFSNFYNNCGNLYLGAFAADRIPSLDQIGEIGALIVNTEESDSYGEHWLAIIFLKSRKLEFFDSFGRSPTEFNAHITNFVSMFPEVHWNSLRF